jgi:hypothetical protein
MREATVRQGAVNRLEKYLEELELGEWWRVGREDL